MSDVLITWQKMQKIKPETETILIMSRITDNKKWPLYHTSTSLMDGLKQNLVGLNEFSITCRKQKSLKKCGNIINMGWSKAYHRV